MSVLSRSTHKLKINVAICLVTHMSCTHAQMSIPVLMYSWYYFSNWVSFVLTFTGEDFHGVDNDLSALWRSVIMTTDDYDDDSNQPQIGDLLRARGRLQVYRGARQISCKHISKHLPRNKVLTNSPHLPHGITSIRENQGKINFSGKSGNLFSF